MYTRVGCWLRDTRGDSTAKECRTSRDRAQAMRFPDTSSRPTFKGRRKVSRGVGTRGEGWGGLGCLLPFKRVAPATSSVTWSGEGLGKVCVCCWHSAWWEARAGGRHGSSLLLSGGGRGCALGSAGPAPGPGDWRRAGGEEAEGHAEPGAHVRAGAGLARPAERAEQARGPAEPPTLEQPELEEEEEERRRGRRRRWRVAPAGRAWGARRRGRCCWRSCRWVSARELRRGAESWWGAGAAAAPGPGHSGCLGRLPGDPAPERGAAGGAGNGVRPPGARCTSPWARARGTRSRPAWRSRVLTCAGGVAPGRFSDSALYLLAAGNRAHLELPAPEGAGGSGPRARLGGNMSFCYAPP